MAGPEQLRLGRLPLPPFAWVLGAWIAAMVVVRALQHLSFGTNAFDLSVFDTMLWSTTQGEWLAMPFYGTWTTHLAWHSTPVLFLLVPLYWVFEGPGVLLVLQVLVGAALAGMVFAAARARLRDPRAAWLLGVAALFYKPWIDAVMYDFHPELLFPVALLAAWVAAQRDAGILYWVAIALALSIKEDMALYLIGFGLLVAWLVPQQRRRGLVTIGLSAAWFAVVMGVALPWIRARSGLPADYVYASLWGHLGSSLPQVIGRAITDPAAVLAAIDLRVTLGALLSMLGPLLLLPLGSPWALGALIPLGVLATSSSPVMQGLGLHYAVPLIGFFWIAAIESLRRIEERSPVPDPRRAASPDGSPAAGRATVVLTACVLVALASFATTRWNAVRPRTYASLAEREAVNELLAALPADASVSAQSALVPHVPKRWGLQMLPTVGDAEYVLLNTALNPWPLDRTELEELRDALLTQEFDVLEAAGTAVLLERR